jgi:hypothetical protein
MPAISNTRKNMLNKMNKVAQVTTLGTIIQNMKSPTMGEVTVSAAQASASFVSIEPGFSITGYMFQYSRSGSPAPTRDFKVAVSGSMKIMPINSGSIVANDVVNYIVW